MVFSNLQWSDIYNSVARHYPRKLVLMTNCSLQDRIMIVRISPCWLLSRMTRASYQIPRNNVYRRLIYSNDHFRKGAEGQKEMTNRPSGTTPKHRVAPGAATPTQDELSQREQGSRYVLVLGGTLHHRPRHGRETHLFP